MGNGLPKLNVMVVDDHRVLTESLSVFLNATPDMRVCAVAENLTNAFAAVEKSSPDVILLDIDLGGGESGFTLLEKVKATRPGVRVVMVSTFDGEMYRRMAQVMGADDYIAKGASISEIVDAIRNSMRRDAARPVGSMVVSQSRKEAMEKIFGSLSENERRVVRMLGSGLSQKEIAASIGITASTVGTYVQRARDKFGARSVPHLVSIVEGIISEQR